MIDIDWPYRRADFLGDIFTPRYDVPKRVSSVDSDPKRVDRRKIDFCSVCYYCTFR